MSEQKRKLDVIPQCDILPLLQGINGTLEQSAANLIEDLMEKIAEQSKSLDVLTQAYNKLLDHMPAWISVKDKLPEAEDEYGSCKRILHRRYFTICSISLYYCSCYACGILATVGCREQIIDFNGIYILPVNAVLFLLYGSIFD